MAAGDLPGHMIRAGAIFAAGASVHATIMAVADCRLGGWGGGRLVRHRGAAGDVERHPGQERDRAQEAEKICGDGTHGRSLPRH